MTRIRLIGGVALLLAALGPATASARGTFDKSSVLADTEVDVVLNAPVEILVGYNQKVVLTVPDGFRVLSCDAINEYKCAQSAAANPRRTLVTWEKTTAGQEVVSPTEQFPFSMRTIATAGKYRFEVDQFYSNGEVQRTNGPEGSANAAPTLTVTSSGAPGGTNTTVAPANLSPPPTFASSFRPEPFTPVPFTPVRFEEATTPTTVLDTTPPVESTDTAAPNIAIKNTGSDGGGIQGAERTILFGAVLLAVAVPLVSTVRQRRNSL